MSKALWTALDLIAGIIVVLGIPVCMALDLFDGLRPRKAMKEGKA